MNLNAFFASVSTALRGSDARVMLFQMPLYSQSNASFADLMFIYFSWVIILLFCNASLLQVKLVLLFFVSFPYKTKKSLFF